MSSVGKKHDHRAGTDTISAGVYQRRISPFHDLLWRFKARIDPSAPRVLVFARWRELKIKRLSMTVDPETGSRLIGSRWIMSLPWGYQLMRAKRGAAMGRLRCQTFHTFRVTQKVWRMNRLCINLVIDSSG